MTADQAEYLPVHLTHGWSDRYIDGCIEAGAEAVGEVHHATCLRVKAYRAAIREWSAQHPPPYDDPSYDIEAPSHIGRHLRADQ